MTGKIGESAEFDRFSWRRPRFSPIRVAHQFADNRILDFPDWDEEREPAFQDLPWKLTAAGLDQTPSFESSTRITGSERVAIGVDGPAELNPLAAPVDVTGAANGWARSGVSRSHPSEFAGDFGGCDVSDRTVDRPDESDSGHALV